MVIGTRKSNANAHPGRILLGSQQPRRTRKQIEEDKACQEAEAMAAREEELMKHNAVVARIAQLEEDEEEYEERIRSHSQRPDLLSRSSYSASGSKSSNRTPSSVSREQNLVRDTRNKMLPLAVAAVGDEVDEAMLSPPASTVLDEYEEQITEDAASDDNFEDELGSQLGSSDSSDNSGYASVEKPTTRRRVRGPAAVRLRSPPHPSIPSPCTKYRQQKEKTKRGALRAEVSGIRNGLAHQSSAARNNKRRASPDRQPQLKRLKRCNALGPEGFTANWRTKIKEGEFCDLVLPRIEPPIHTVSQVHQGQLEATRGSSQAITEGSTRSSTPSETRLGLGHQSQVSRGSRANTEDGTQSSTPSETRLGLGRQSHGSRVNTEDGTTSSTPSETRLGLRLGLGRGNISESSGDLPVAARRTEQVRYGHLSTN
jgi:hypothetical protein